MEFMTIPKARKWIVFVGLAIFMVSGGCGQLDEKPAGDYLNLALAGMAGSDGVTFEGATALLRGSEGKPYASINYGGKVTDHSTVTLYSLLPDRESSQTVATPKKASKAADNKTFYSKIEKKKGQWQVLSESNMLNETPLSRLNPLQQLEDLSSLSKQVTEESGAGGGTRTLRIELSPDVAREQLVKQLEQELAILRIQGETQVRAQISGRPELKKELDSFWQKKSKELKNRLASAQVKTVYHLKVDSRRNLPKRLAWTRTISYPSDVQKVLSETYVTQIDFYGYR